MMVKHMIMKMERLLQPVLNDKQSGRTVEFTVFPVEGSYNGMCKARTYELEIDAPQRPSEVLVNNVPIMDWQYGDDHKVRFSLHQENNELIKAMLR